MNNKVMARAACLPKWVLRIWIAVAFAVTGLQTLSPPALALAADGGAAGPAVPAKPQSVAEKIAASQQLLDINTATADQLTALPGMGPAYAARVIAGRPYTAKNQLATRGILPKDEYERIRELIIAHRPKPTEPH
jgi:DNA uptake protein ComE-like DNA-binding protein